MTKTEALVKLIKAYENYIDLLTDELNEVVSMAAIHGWKSDRAEKGEAARIEIETLKEILKGYQ